MKYRVDVNTAGDPADSWTASAYSQLEEMEPTE